MPYVEMARVHQGWGVGPGDVVNVDDATAAQLIASGNAMLYDGPLPESQEKQQLNIDQNMKQAE